MTVYVVGVKVRGKVIKRYTSNAHIAHEAEAEVMRRYKLPDGATVIARKNKIK